MVSTETTLLGKLFPDAKFHVNGLQAGCHEITGYYLNFAAGFYTCSLTHETTFVQSHEWEKVLNKFKDEIVGDNMIVKGNGFEH